MTRGSNYEIKDFYGCISLALRTSCFILRIEETLCFWKNLCLFCGLVGIETKSMHLGRWKPYG